MQDLYDTVEDLRALADELMVLSVELGQNEQPQAARTTARMVLTVQEREILLRKHADRLSKTGNLGRRVSDQLQDRGDQAARDSGHA